MDKTLKACSETSEELEKKCSLRGFQSFKHLWTLNHVLAMYWTLFIYNSLWQTEALRPILWMKTLRHKLIGPLVWGHPANKGWNLKTGSWTLAEKAMAPHSSTLVWKIPWTEEPGRLQSMRSLRVRHNWATSPLLFTFMCWRRKWQPTPVFLPGESQGQGSLVGCRLWGCTESDTTEVA